MNSRPMRKACKSMINRIDFDDEETESALQDFVVDVYNFMLTGGDEFRRMQLRMMHDNLRSMLLGMRDRFAEQGDIAGFQKAILRGGIVMGAYSMIKLSEPEEVANVN